MQRMEYTILLEVAEGVQDCFKHCLQISTENSGLNRTLQEEDKDNCIPMMTVKAGKHNAKIESEWCGHGIIRIFKNDGSPQETVEDDNLLRELGDGRMIAMLFVPNYLTVPQLLNWFIGTEIMNQVIHFQLIRMSKNFGRFMLLMKFKEEGVAREFQKNFNGKKFNNVDPETCHVVAVKELVFHEGIFKQDSEALPYMLKYPFSSGIGLVELPMCPVCLEKLDADVTGLITIPCQHTFHCKCLDRWKGGDCPVCRYSQVNDTETGQPQCRVCSQTNNLWICLICGHVGCGRYNSQHAIRHYEETNHCFAMDLESKRVWDYAGDNYVHRIVQNEIDGKLVEVGEAQDATTSKSSKEYHLEYVQVLISQLESQREYYENQIKQMHDEFHSLEHSMKANKETEQRKRLEQLVDLKMKELKEKLSEELLINNGLQANIDHLSIKVRNADKERQRLEEEKLELESQIQDLMFHFETQSKISGNEELQNSTLVLQPGPGATSTPASKKKTKKKKNKK